MVTASLLAVTCLAVALHRPGDAAAAAWSGTETQRSQLDRLVRNVIDAGAPGVIVRVDDGRGRPIQIAEQASWTRPDHLLQASDEFREASNTKTMMATLVLQLAAEGRLALTDPAPKRPTGHEPYAHQGVRRYVLRVIGHEHGTPFLTSINAATRPDR